MKGIIGKHGKSQLLEFLAKLACVERSIQELNPHIRDHVVHALLTFILGIYLNEEMMSNIGEKVKPFQWKLAALFHDISYPVEIANDIKNSYVKNVNDISYNISRVHNISFRTIPNREFLKLEKRNLIGRKITSFNVIKKCLKNWGLNINPRKEYGIIFKKGNICHGMLSSLSVLFLIDKMYQKNNPKRQYKTKWDNGKDWNEKYFVNDVIPACSAIYLHNIKNIDLFIAKKINPMIAPVAFLLKLCDSLQEWDRQKKEVDSVYPSTNFDIKIIDGNKLVYYANIDNNDNNNIKNTIESILEGLDFLIISR